MKNQLVNLINAPVAPASARLATLRLATVSVAPGHRTSGITTGVHAHAAVRMHDLPVFEGFWTYCQKSWNTHFQRWKFANLR